MYAFALFLPDLLSSVSRRAVFPQSGTQASGQAGAPPELVMRIYDGPVQTKHAEDLAKLPRHNVVLNDHGKQVHYEGPLLHDVLAGAGVSFGKQLHGKQLSSYVAAFARDGYEVVYALADFDPTVVDSDVILADKREGQPIDSHEGPLRIVVPHDKRPTRSIRMLKEIMLCS